MKAAIVVLTRGYQSVDYYSKLILRNLNIYENFNKKLDKQYPLIIFHEGNIPKEHQDHILSVELNDDVRFVDISKDFTWPSNIPTSDIKDHGFSIGYRLMCRFNSYLIWHYCKDFDYIWRIDEDTYIDHLDYDLFGYMRDNKLDYVVGRFQEESHVLTNETIPQKVKDIMGDKWELDMYNQKEMWVPYTNLYAARVGLFLNDDTQYFLNKLSEDPRSLTHRWGDNVIMGLVLKLFSDKSKYETIQNFAYIHGSHMCMTKNGKALNGILTEHEASVYGLVLSGQQPEHYTTPEENEEVTLEWTR